MVIFGVGGICDEVVVWCGEMVIYLILLFLLSFDYCVVIGGEVVCFFKVLVNVLE